jgi:pimeloyl-ACP methyl ester carboxylesterase
VLVHGSWVSHASWDLVVPPLSESCRVLRYDRRGHSASERPAAPGSIHEDVADLAALIEQLGLAPAWVVGNSFGASIALRLAGRRPDLLRGLALHEPPLFGLLAGDPAFAPLLDELGARIGAVVARITGGDHAGAAEQFVDEVALGPGSWAAMPAELRAVFVANAPSFLDEAQDPEQLAFDPASIRGFARPVLLSLGDQSPPGFAPVIARLRESLPHVEVRTFGGAGHVPHTTHPQAYADAILAFVHGRSS